MNGKLLVAGGSFDFLLLTFEFSKLVRVAGCWILDCGLSFLASLREIFKKNYPFLAFCTHKYS
jgi:hypothetical protein